MAADDRVGYGRPPKHTRFKKGVSGNPKGRPAGTHNLASDLAAELGESVPIREDGRTRRISKQRALVKALVVKALHGDMRAAGTLLTFLARGGHEPASETATACSANDLEILRRFAPRLLAVTQTKPRRKKK